MRIKFITNLGANDASQLGLRFEQCGRGMECEVGGAAGQKLVACGLAIECELPAKAAKEIKAVPVVELQSTVVQPQPAVAKGKQIEPPKQGK